MTRSTPHQLEESKQFIYSSSKIRPTLGFVLGSGLSGFARHVKDALEIPYAKIPHFAASSVEGHPGKLVMGRIHDVPVAVMMGRLHAYEGLTFQQVVFPVQTLAVMGIKTLVVTNAAGGLSSTMRPGDFMVIRDHINLTGDNPLRGPNLPLGPRFVDLTEPYDSGLRAALKKSLAQEKVRSTDGVYIGVLGPTYETSSEIKFYAKIGGGSVGMSTVAEVIAARHAGLKVVGLSCITNLGTGLSKKRLTHEDVKRVAEKVEERFGRVLINFTKRIKNQI